MTPEEMLLSFLSKFAGQEVNYWKPVNSVADVILGHDKTYSPKDRTLRHRKRVEVSKVLNSLIQQGKVKRRQDWCRRINTVRINEAFVQNRSFIR